MSLNLEIEHLVNAIALLRLKIIQMLDGNLGVVA